jgi:hypothetical protein
MEIDHSRMEMDRSGELYISWMTGMIELLDE